MSDYPMLISNKLHSFRNFGMQNYKKDWEYAPKEQKYYNKVSAVLFRMGHETR